MSIVIAKSKVDRDSMEYSQDEVHGGRDTYTVFTQLEQVPSLVVESHQSSSSFFSSSAHGVTSELEEVLTDTELPYLRSLGKATRIELKLLFRLAAPAIGMYLINNLMSLSTRSFAGHLGTLQLAAASLGNQGIQLFAYGLMVRIYECSLADLCYI